MKVKFKLNGEQTEMDVPPNMTLLDSLRTKLGVRSPKCGCDRGDCGTCTVMINGKTVRSCLVLGVEAEGQTITTLEGIMTEAKGMTPLQKVFLDKNSFQCGFCAPGMIMSATELLREHPEPSKEEVKEHLSGNLCRCTGYTPIIDAMMEHIEKARKEEGK